MRRKILVCGVALFAVACSLFLSTSSTYAYDVYTSSDLVDCIGSGETCVLMSDIDAGGSESVPININNHVSVSIDFAGHSILNRHFLINDAEVEFYDSVGGGSLETSREYYGAIEASNSVLIISDIVVSNSLGNGAEISDSDLTVNSGEYHGSIVGLVLGNTNATINDGKFVAVNDAIEYVSASGLGIQGGHVVINGGVFTGSGINGGYGADINIPCNEGVEINGGQFSGDTYGVWFGASSNCSDEQNEIVVNGGSFDGGYGGARIDDFDSVPYSLTILGGTFTGNWYGINILCDRQDYCHSENNYLYLVGGNYRALQEREEEWPYSVTAIRITTSSDLTLDDYIVEGSEMSEAGELDSRQEYGWNYHYSQATDLTIIPPVTENESGDNGEDDGEEIVDVPNTGATTPDTGFFTGLGGNGKIYMIVAPFVLFGTAVIVLNIHGRAKAKVKFSRHK